MLSCLTQHAGRKGSPLPFQLAAFRALGKVAVAAPWAVYAHYTAFAGAVETAIRGIGKSVPSLTDEGGNFNFGATKAGEEEEEEEEGTASFASTAAAAVDTGVAAVIGSTSSNSSATSAPTSTSTSDPVASSRAPQLPLRRVVLQGSKLGASHDEKQAEERTAAREEDALRSKLICAAVDALAAAWPSAVFESTTATASSAATAAMAVDRDNDATAALSSLSVSVHSSATSVSNGLSAAPSTSSAPTGCSSSSSITDDDDDRILSRAIAFQLSRRPHSPVEVAQIAACVNDCAPSSGIRVVGSAASSAVIVAHCPRILSALVALLTSSGSFSERISICKAIAVVAAKMSILPLRQLQLGASDETRRQQLQLGASDEAWPGLTAASLALVECVRKEDKYPFARLAGLHALTVIVQVCTQLQLATALPATPAQLQLESALSPATLEAIRSVARAFLRATDARVASAAGALLLAAA